MSTDFIVEIVDEGSECLLIVNDHVAYLGTHGWAVNKEGLVEWVNYPASP